jgi:hypothetical protein
MGRSTILLAAKTDWVRPLFRRILESHGYDVLMDGCGFTPLVIGHAFPGTLDLLLAEADYKGEGSGKALADNLGVLRPIMPSLYFVVREGRILLGKEPEAGFTKEFSPASFLKEVAESVTYGFFQVE